MRAVIGSSLLLSLALFLAPTVAAAQSSSQNGDSSGECNGGFCGTPNQTGGGGCGCGCGCSILINQTDRGDTYQFADDFDNDGFEDDFDNCPFAANADQADSDGDAVGDACDTCPGAADATQRDTDGDGLGDVCDPDIDNDGVLNANDICPTVGDPAQRNSDSDGRGDACDDDDDNDGLLDGDDNCPLYPNANQVLPTDQALCDLDDDHDGVPNRIDNCLGVSNVDQADQDGDGMGDACDGDVDGDEIANLSDNCPKSANPSLLDSDRDGVGDSCDDRFCFVIDQSEPDHCLDNDTTFSVLSVPHDIAQVGEERRLHIFANRDNAAMRYTWTVIKAPSDSEAKIANPRGSVTYSNAFEYHYLRDQVANFTPDVAGTYELQLSAELVFPDTKYPQNNTSRTTFTLEAQESAEGAQSCSHTSTKDGGLGAFYLLVLMGAGMVMRRRQE